MGVDYTAFACWGVRVTGATADDFEKHSSILGKAEDALSYATYGAASYGGDGGIMLIISDTYASVDMRREPGARAIPREIPSNRWEAVLHQTRERLREQGVQIEFEGEPGWHVCGLVS
jgi:hypothetical protein